MSTETDEALEMVSTELETADEPAIQLAGSNGLRSAPCGNVALDMLLMQAAVSSELGIIFEDGLLIGGWTPEDTEALNRDRLAFSQAFSKFHQDRDASKRLTEEHRAVLAESVLLRDRLITALLVVLEGVRNPRMRSHLKLSGTRQSAIRMYLWFTEAVGHMMSHVPALTRLLKEDPVALAQSQQEKLGRVMGAHRNDLMGVTSLAKEQHAARVKLALTIARQQRAAAFAFRGSEAVLKQFVPVWSKKFRHAKASALPPASEPALPPAAATIRAEVPAPVAPAARLEPASER